MKYDSTRADLDFLNPHEIEQIKENEPTTLTECMQFAKDNDDFVPLESVIYTTEKNIAEAKELLISYINECGQMTNGIVKSRFSKILKILK
jgi:hypothetical protein